ncbi:MAG: HAMP domain-containing sensor histidine kinase [Pseudomonadota bacterium]
MSHEVRTPINSILALSRMLIERLDGELSDEQDKQARLIRAAAESLSELVDDMLDLAKAEAGKIEIHPATFVIEELFSALRGMMRPLLTNDEVTLVFEDALALQLHTDESKVAQILRNLISNALKFTEQGEIRVSVQPSEDDSSVMFQVRDTGIGIQPGDQARIFEEYTQNRQPAAAAGQRLRPRPAAVETAGRAAARPARARQHARRRIGLHPDAAAPAR